MNRPKRYAFPVIYVAALLPILLDSNPLVKLSIVAGCAAAAAFINPTPAFRVAILLLLALGSLIPLLAIVQGSACWGPHPPWAVFFQCVGTRAGIVLLNAAILGATVMLAVANEWRGSMLTTINGLFLPRSLRFVAVVAGAMIGEFQKAGSRVHQAFTGRGEALPAISWRNAIALPAMLAATWAAVLNGAAARLGEQWASDAFWSKYVPNAQDRLGTMTNRDALVIVGCGMIVVTSILSAGAR
jgi:hypothetical protein